MLELYVLEECLYQGFSVLLKDLSFSVSLTVIDDRLL